MSHLKNSLKLTDKSKLDTQDTSKLEDDITSCDKSNGHTYAVTVTKKPSIHAEETSHCNRKSFISIHSTDQLCQLVDIETSNLDEFNLEVLSLNEVFPSTSEESLSNEDDSPAQKKRSFNKKQSSKSKMEKSSYVPSNSKSATGSGRSKEVTDPLPVYSSVDIPKSTLYVIGSNPGEPKMSYQDPPKKISKTMKKFLRNMEKHKSEQGNKSGEKAISKLTTMRGILKDGRCGPECTGDSVQESENAASDGALPIPLDYTHYTKQNPDKNVTFNTQVVIIHFTGDLCVGQSVETLSKEKDQQARNSELRKTFLTKYNELWRTQK